MAEEAEKVIATNRKAFFNYHVLERAEAGVALLGSEVKSIREGGLNFRDSFVEFRGGELYLVGCRIGPYSHANIQNHAEERDRKLLLHRREIEKVVGRIAERGWTLVPTRIYFTNGRAKVELALARGKDRFDKRQSIKAREMKRDMDRQLRDAGR